VEGVEASLVDASIPMVFVRARDLGLAGTESPTAMDGDAALCARLEGIRVAAATLMGIPGSAATPKIAVVTAPIAFTALDGVAYEAGAADVVGRAISMGNCHRAFPLTSSMCLAVAARIEGSLVHEVSTAAPGVDVRLGHPSGVLPLDAAVTRPGGDYHAERVTVYRTARRLMEGWVRIP
jgi:2-methylaconitate cis-trans-isomerase PrpF